jgi:hypothetical protein
VHVKIISVPSHSTPTFCGYCYFTDISGSEGAL